MVDSAAELTVLLRQWSNGDTQALEHLTPMVYEQLRRIARARHGGERQDRTLQTTALVHEAYLRLTGIDHIDWQDRRHFFAVASQMMRRILVDAARARRTAKRGGGGEQLEPNEWEGLPDMSTERARDLCAVDDALASLARLDTRRAQVVELRFFGGLTVEETAEVMQIAPITVMRDWKVARAWLMKELRADAR